MQNFKELVGKFRKPKPNVLKSNYLVPSLLLANAINPQDINDYGCLIAHLVLSTYKGCMTSKLWMGFLYIPISWYILAFSNPHTPYSLQTSNYTYLSAELRYLRNAIYVDLEEDY